MSRSVVADIAHVAIVGASAAGAAAARVLRQEGYRGRISLIDRDPDGCYERPPLSKQMLLAESFDLSAAQLLNADECQTLDIATYFGIGVDDLQAATGELILTDGRTLHADVILLATGGKASCLPVPGGDGGLVHVLRSAADARRIREKLEDSGRIAVIGGGLIGAEAVASFLKLGKEVCWLDGAAQPLAHVLPQPIAEYLIAHHVSAGASLRTDVRIGAIRDNSPQGGVCLELGDGERIAVDMVVLGVGMVPDTRLARSAGLALAAGAIAVDKKQRTSHPRIYAAGDVASLYLGAGTYSRNQHWKSAEHQGMAAARAILGLPVPETPIPWFWSDQGDLHVEMAGKKGDETILRNEAKGLVAYEMKDGRIVGAASINNPNAVRLAMRLIRADAHISPTLLRDTGFDMRSLLRQDKGK
ncbi:NAD(P)/FAD-dependent oxidoreductase [Kordiimonas gwangyangensis]|uniref:NAD(P)/FAD-dependent oxidoreductase n=1 Tax=Kordiimonas gwangyangensis TaxID=288022 RepID=UPI00037C2298|nr:FAD-dependent oxidoreductase [Kordiimonas gwangyangensis]